MDEHQMGNAPFAAYLISFILPFSALVFLLTAPHPGWGTLAFVSVPIIVSFADAFASEDRRPAPEASPGWPYDWILYGLATVQFTNILLLPWVFRGVSVVSVEAVAACLIVGGASAYSGIVVAHELIHRRDRNQRKLGRLLLTTALYDHLHIEHIAIHHKLVGTPDDPVTARLGESFAHYLVRTMKGQVGGSWKIETKRLSRTGRASILGNGVFHGFLLYLVLFAYMTAVGGASALFVFVGQAIDAVVLLQAVNYFEHYGLVRSGRKISYADSWDSGSWVSRFAMVGLSRHADHHVDTALPFHQLSLREPSPRLPYGYLGMVFLTVFMNNRCRTLLARELQARRLGPFAEQAPAADPGARALVPQ